MPPVIIVPPPLSSASLPVRGQMHDFTSNSQFSLLEGINRGGLKQLESIDNPKPFISGVQRPPSVVSPATPPSWVVMEGALGRSGKNPGLAGWPLALAG